MWCLRARRLLSAFLDHELDSSTESRVSFHLRRCDSCRRELARIARGASLAEGARRVVLPAPLRPILTGIMALEPKPVRGSNGPARFLLPMVTTLTLAFAVAGFDFLPRENLLPFRNAGTVYALDFGFKPSAPDEDLVNKFRARYTGKFREFPWDGSPDPSWVPFRFKFPAQLPHGLQLTSVMIFDRRFCGSLGLVFADGGRNAYLVQQPADQPISLSGLKTNTDEVCQYSTTQCRVGQYRIITWTADNLRSVILSNLDRAQIELIIDSLREVR